MDIKSLREEFSKIHSEAQAFLDASKDKEVTADEQAAQDERFAKMDKLQKQIDDAQKLASYKFANDEVEKPQKSADQKSYEFAEGASIEVLDASPKVKRAEFAKAASIWAATGRMPAQFATITSATNSGILMPEYVDSPIAPTSFNAFRAGCESVGLGLMRTSDTGIRKVPILTATAGAVVTETDSSENENAASTSDSLTLSPESYESGSTWFSNIIVNANGFDITQEVIPVLRYGKELGLESAIGTDLKADTTLSSVEWNGTSTTTMYTSMVSLNNKLPQKYNVAKFIVLANEYYQLVEGLQSSTGGPVLTPDAQNQTLKRFNGTPVFRCDALDVLDAPGFIVSALGFRLRDAGPEYVERYVNQPGRPAQIGFNLIGVHDYDWASGSSGAVVRLLDNS